MVLAFTVMLLSLSPRLLKHITEASYICIHHASVMCLSNLGDSDKSMTVNARTMIEAVTPSRYVLTAHS